MCPVTPRKYSMFSSTQCPKALAWMASFALAAGKREDAEQWLVEMIGAVLFRVSEPGEASALDHPAPRSDTAGMS